MQRSKDLQTKRGTLYLSDTCSRYRVYVCGVLDSSEDINFSLCGVQFQPICHTRTRTRIEQPRAVVMWPGQSKTAFHPTKASPTVTVSLTRPPLRALNVHADVREPLSLLCCHFIWRALRYCRMYACFLCARAVRVEYLYCHRVQTQNYLTYSFVQRLALGHNSNYRPCFKLLLCLLNINKRWRPTSFCTTNVL